MTKSRYHFTPARQIGNWWWSYVRDTATGEVVTECRGCVASSAERDAKAWIRMAEEDRA